MDKKITELKGLDQLTGAEYLVVASRDNAENYKIKVSDFTEDAIDVDSALSETSKNPVQNKVITEHINKLEDRLEDVEDNTGRLLNLHIAQVETVTLDADKEASVEIYDLGTDINNIKNLAFKFAIPRGATGQTGEQGITGVGGRTVFVFTSSKEKPDKPQGGSWDPITNIVTYPVGWSPTDNLTPPIWMSNATFNEFKLVIDWSEPIQVTGADGAAGADGIALEFIYKQAETEDVVITKPSNNPNITDFVPRDEGWDDHPNGVSRYMLCEYVCTRSKDEETGLWSDWNGPVLWSKYGANGKDGDGVEYIYQITKEERSPSRPGRTPASNSPTSDYNDREFLPAHSSGEQPWTDNPTGVSSTYSCEWVCVRKFRWDTETWGDWSYPSLWGKYGKDGSPGAPGDDGTSIVIKGSYDSYEELIAEHPTGELGDTYVIDGELWVWDGDSWTNCGSFKGDPGDSAYVHIKFSDDGGATFTKDLTGEFNDGELPGKYIGIRIDNERLDSTNVNDYKPWIKFNGDDGFGYEYIFTRTTEFNAPEIPKTRPEYNVGSFVDENGVTWTDDPSGVDSTNKYEWSCFRTSDKNGVWGDWRGKRNSTTAWLFAMYAESVPGKTGKQGPILYAAGYWQPGTYYQEGYEDSVTGEWIATATPYVMHNDEYYVLMTRSTTSEPSSDSEDWLEMVKMEAIYTEILLADRATVGNACFYGNYMFSQSGEGDLSQFDITTSNPYDSNSGFKPNWCVNLVTGEMWTGAGASYFNQNGGGHLADGNISWNDNATEVLFGGGSSNPYAVKTSLTDTGIEVYLQNVGATKSDRTLHLDNEGVIVSEGRSGAAMSITPYDIQRRSSGNADWESIIGSGSSGDGGSSGGTTTSSNVLFVTELPSDSEALSNTLYVLID